MRSQISIWEREVGDETPGAKWNLAAVCYLAKRWSEEDEAAWSKLQEFRGEVAKAFEEARRSRGFGSSLEAQVSITRHAELTKILARPGIDLAEVLIVSRATTGFEETVDASWTQSKVFAGAFFQISRATRAKCPRCWRFDAVTPEGAAEGETLCGRCASVVARTGNL